MLAQMLPTTMPVPTKLDELSSNALLSLALGMLGVALLILGHKLFHAIDMGKKLTRIDFKAQIEKGNMAAALYEGLIEAAFLLGLAYIIGHAIS